MARTSLFLTAALAAAASPAGADPAPAAPISTYAVVVGSNLGGAGQVELHYAEDDAHRVAQVLTELGDYPADHVDVLVHPTPDALREHLDTLQREITADLAAGRQSRVFFYYSGHARATAIDLGDAEMPLTELRQRLFQTSATLTVVVLDACQSGAFSRVKGAEPAADFSFNSRQHLDASGIAVLASSSGSELSQESEALRSSYFTHHFLVGLRGAGDANGDGQVTLDEAYRYAYHQTLLATAETAVGGQHVTFEADLKGHGDVALSFPRAATSTITLPASLVGQALVEDKHSKTVVAETYKATGAAVRIAVAPGEYDVLVRQGDSLSRCEVTGGGEVDLDHCSREKLQAAATKGGGLAHPYRVEVFAAVGGERDDGYTQNLAAFGYHQDLFATSSGFGAIGLRQLTPRILVGAQASWTQMPEWERADNTTGGNQTLDWSTGAILAIARGEYPLLGDPPNRSLTGYAQLGGGLGIGHTAFHGSQDEDNSQLYFGPAFELGAGLRATFAHLPGFGISAGYAFDYAPVITDLIGHTHASGGSRLTLGASYQF